MLPLHADLVDYHAGRQRADLLQHRKAVLPQRGSGLTISTMTSESPPTIGASSMEPFNLMISTV